MIFRPQLRALMLEAYQRCFALFPVLSLFLGYIMLTSAKWLLLLDTLLVFSPWNCWQENRMLCVVFFNLYSNTHLAVFHPVKLIPWKSHKIAVRDKAVEVLSVGQSSNVPGICMGALSLPRNGQRIPRGFFVCHPKLKAVLAIRWLEIESLAYEAALPLCFPGSSGVGFVVCLLFIVLFFTHFTAIAL